MTDDPCWVLLSSAGLLARTGSRRTAAARRTSATTTSSSRGSSTSARGDVGLVTSAGRVVKINALDLPTVPTTANAPNLQGGAPVVELVTLAAGERMLGLTACDTDSPGLALGTAGGVVKRVHPEALGKGSWDVIRLERRRGGRCGRTAPQRGDLVFITSDAQLLHFPAARSGRRAAPGAGWRGSSSGRARVIFFGAVRRRPMRRGHGVGLVGGPARNRRRGGQGDPVR